MTQSQNITTSSPAVLSTKQAASAVAKPQGRLSYYGCGGTGVKNAALFEPMRGQREPGICDVNVVYVDTSFSDIPAGVDKKHVYLLSDTDGSGGKRAENAKSIAAVAPDILRVHEAGDINVVVCSGSGGSGSVFAPTLASELASQGKLVIMVMVGDATTVQFMTNTMNTIRSANGIVNVRGNTIPLVYFENSEAQSEEQVNAKVAMFVTGVAALWSRQNGGLDSKDLLHFLRPELISEFPPQLAMLEMHFKEVPAESHGSVMTVASLATSREEARLPFVVDAHYVGIAPDDLSDKFRKNTPIHLIMRDQSFNEVMEVFETRKRDIMQNRGNRSTKRDFMQGANVMDNGLVI